MEDSTSMKIEAITIELPWPDKQPCGIIELSQDGWAFIFQQMSVAM